MRMRKNFIVMLGLLVMTLLLLGPYLFHLKLGEASQEGYQQFMNRKRKEELMHKKHLGGDGMVAQMVVGKGDHPDSDDGAGEGKGKEEEQEQDGSPLTKATLTPERRGNFEPRDPPPQYGPGEKGEPVYTGMNEKQKADVQIQQYGFNMLNSDKIAMNRTIPDTRLEECKYWQYSENLPTASVILVFHNEGFSTLEVVMVDDFSDKDNLKGPLEDYLKRFGGKVKLYRNEEREGLINTRTRGAELATGDVIVFLDAHCECNRNWLVPLLDRIREDRKTMAVPIVDGIDWDNFQYRPVYSSVHHRGIFESWTRDNTTVNPTAHPHTQEGSLPWTRNTSLSWVATILVCASGGENFELSFKIWQCGGRIEWVPCSRVGHIYRNFMPYSTGQHREKIPVITLNYMRVVEVWLGEEFREYFYTREPMVRGYPIGDISKQVQFKKDYNCKSFKWFMDNVAYEIYDLYPLPPPNKAWGEFKEKRGERCWDTMGEGMGGGAIGAYYCHHGGSNQYFRLNERGQLGTGEWCLRTENEDTIHVRRCDVEPSGPWSWEEGSGLIRNTDLNKCIDVGKDNRLHLHPCDPSISTQLWDIREVYPWKN
ncbi:hypothetical protein ACOMHN_019619 [Nucella lapillus]